MYTESAQTVELLQEGRVEVEPFWRRMLRMAFPDQRKRERMPAPPVVGYLGTARASKPYTLSDISGSGFRLLTDERWLLETEMPITFERTDLTEQEERDCYTVQATVRRSDGEGVAFSIVLSEGESLAVCGNPLRSRWMTAEEMNQFLDRMKKTPEEAPNQEPGPAITDEGTHHGAGLKAAFGD